MICIIQIRLHLPPLKSVNIQGLIFTRGPPHSIEKLFMRRSRSKCRSIQKSAINMHVSPSTQFTKQLVIFIHKRRAKATDCFYTRSGFRFTVHNKHMRSFKIKSSQASTFSYASYTVGLHV